MKERAKCNGYNWKEIPLIDIENVDKCLNCEKPECNNCVYNDKAYKKKYVLTQEEKEERARQVKERRKAYAKEYAQKNKERINEQRKAYREKNKEKIREERKAYRLKKKLEEMKNAQ